MSLDVTRDTMQTLIDEYGFSIRGSDTSDVLQYFTVYPRAKWGIPITITPFSNRTQRLPVEAITSLMVLPIDAWKDFLKAEYDYEIRPIGHE